VITLEAILITGTIGVGKTIVASGLCEILGEHRVPAAAIDLDWLGWTSVSPPGGVDRLIAENLKTLRPNFEASGITHLVLTRALRKNAQVESLRKSLPGARLQVVRLEAPRELIESRLEGRDRGANLERHLVESREFEQIEAGVEDFSVANDARPVRAVAEEVLKRTGWL
jgi:dephospho-CoA kinase